jgi:5-methylcytosine-specific restriction endonuclease McrA
VDRRSAEAAEYRKKYNTTRWRKLRAARLTANPLCSMCHEDGRVTAATVVDHIIPHRGKDELFFDFDNTQSLCKTHHDGAKQREEIIGYSTAVDASGQPIDPRHPWNRDIPRGEKKS